MCSVDTITFWFLRVVTSLNTIQDVQLHSELSTSFNHISSVMDTLFVGFNRRDAFHQSVSNFLYKMFNSIWTPSMLKEFNCPLEFLEENETISQENLRDEFSGDELWGHNFRKNFPNPSWNSNPNYTWNSNPWDANPNTTDFLL